MEANPWSGRPGSVVLDIGGEVGAAIVTAEDSLAAQELEIRRAGTAWEGRHVAFHARATAAGSVTAAVFAQLEEGLWEVRLRNTAADSRVLPLPVTGGHVTTLAFPA